MRRQLFTTAALAMVLAASPAFADDLDLSGTYTLRGKDRTDRFKGTARLEQDEGGRVQGDLRMEYERWSWSSFGYRPTGRVGTARLEGQLQGRTLRGRRYTTTGMADAISNTGGGESFAIAYEVKLDGGRIESVGGRFDGSRGQDELRDHRPPEPSPEPTPSGDDRIQLPPRLLAVPGTPEAGRQAFKVIVDGSAATLAVSGPGRILQNGAPVAGLSLQPGTHDLQIEGTGDGVVTVTLRRGEAEVARATSTSAVERLYAILWGYQGAEVDYLQGDVSKTLNNILPHLPGYARIEDGPGYDQSKIDQGLADPTNPYRVLIDWCVTRDDLFRYLRRGTLRGISWGSHGFMEPFPGCPDEELDLFESRVWTSPQGRPELTEKKNFVREWLAAIEASSRTHGKLDFVLMHSCCTGGIGSYADEVWDYTDYTTKSRARQVLGDPLPTWDRLRYNSFDALGPHVSYLKTYVGPAYFGLHDVSWSAIRGSLQPSR